jgi:MoxR-like ATPase
VDLGRLREGVVEASTAGMLPEAEFAFLDEVFLGSTAILNTLLGLLNERVFRYGRSVTAVPLRACVGATNVLPDDPALAAFADRFLARIFVEPVADARLEELLEQGARGPEPAGSGVLAALDRLAGAAEQCDLSAVRPLLGAAVRRLRAAGVLISDRRAVRSQNLIAAAATLDARMAATPQDLWVLPLIVPAADAQAAARDLLADLLESSRNGSLAHAAEEFSRGAQARAERLARTGRELLDEFGPEVGDRDARLRFEATLREIDAGFATEDLPGSLRGIRAELIAAVRA